MVIDELDRGLVLLEGNIDDLEGLPVEAESTKH